MFKQEKDITFGNDTRTLKIILFHPSSKLTVREEFYVTTTESLLGNIGGMIGVVIGASLLSLLDYFLAFMQSNGKKIVNAVKG